MKRGPAWRWGYRIGRGTWTPFDKGALVLCVVATLFVVAQIVRVVV